MIVFGVLGSSFNEQELLDKHTLSRQALQEIVEYFLGLNKLKWLKKMGYH